MSCNLNQKEINLRILLSLLLFTIAVVLHSYLALIFGIILTTTALTKTCLIYKVFHINSNLGRQNALLAELPEHNPSAVFIFNDDGKVEFKNDAAVSDFAYIQDINCFKILNHRPLIQNNEHDVKIFTYDGHTYQLDLIGESKHRHLFVYITDVSEVVELNDEIEATQREVIYTMGEIGETRSKETGNHVKRVAHYSELLARLAGLESKEAEMLKIASPMHDIGKVGIPDSILNKPGKLDYEEFEVMKTHAELGYEMLKKSKKLILQAAAIVANEHHEKYDGSGYPRGLRAEEIHIYGRITAIADVFDALGSERVYKKAWKLEKILELFKEQKGVHFDPKLMELFMDNLDAFLEIRDKFKDE